MGIQIFWQSRTRNQTQLIRAGRNSKAVSSKGVEIGIGFVGFWVVFFGGVFLCTMHVGYSLFQGNQASLEGKTEPGVF